MVAKITLLPWNRPRLHTRVSLGTTETCTHTFATFELSIQRGCSRWSGLRKFSGIPLLVLSSVSLDRWILRPVVRAPEWSGGPKITGVRSSDLIVHRRTIQRWADTRGNGVLHSSATPGLDRSLNGERRGVGNNELRTDDSTARSPAARLMRRGKTLRHGDRAPSKRGTPPSAGLRMPPPAPSSSPRRARSFDVRDTRVIEANTRAMTMIKVGGRYVYTLQSSPARKDKLIIF